MKQISEKAREKVKDFNWANVLDKLMETYKIATRK
jgi:glycosyltransferase involved in cell wall biosynthesis